MKNISTEAFTKWAERFINFEKNPKKDLLNLKTMQRYAEYFGNPQEAYKTIHLAGSKGKGSVSTMISSILKEAGIKAGLYTSPHVMDFRERISLSGVFFSDEAYSSAYSKIISGIEDMMKKDQSLDPTWFEIMTALAFLLFKDERCVWGIFETGMGGRLDTTNILKPQACVITPIELEHCQYLGDTIEKIAFEKAGIIKRNTPVFCFKQEENALKVFREKALQMNADFFYLPEILKNIESEPSFDGLKIKIEFNKTDEAGKLFTRPLVTALSLHDGIQAQNAALAACTVKYLFPKMSEDTIESGLSKAWLPARFQILRKEPAVIIDGAHTQKSIELCIGTYSKLTDKKCISVFACADDKKTETIAPLFKNITEKIYITIPGSFKKSDIEKTYSDFVQTYSGSGIEVIKDENFISLLEKVLKEAENKKQPLLITGSFYLAAEAKKIFDNFYPPRLPD